MAAASMLSSPVPGISLHPWKLSESAAMSGSLRLGLQPLVVLEVPRTPDLLEHGRVLPGRTDRLLLFERVGDVLFALAGSAGGELLVQRRPGERRERELQLLLASAEHAVLEPGERDFVGALVPALVALDDDLIELTTRKAETHEFADAHGVHAPLQLGVLL